MICFDKCAAMVLPLALLIVASAGAETGPDLTRSDSLALFNQAVKLYNSTDYPNAIRILNELSSEGHNRLINYYQGVCSYEIGDYKRALNFLSFATQDDSLYPFACYYQAETMIALRNPAAAVEYLKSSLAQDSNYSPARLELIRTLCSLCQFDEAEKFVRNRNDEDEEEAITLCQGLLSANRYEDAYPFLARLVTLDSTNTLVNLMLAETYYETQKYSYAAKVYSSFLSTFGPSPFVIRRLSLCYGKMGKKADFETAISLMRRYFTLAKDTSSEDLGNIGTWYYNLSKFDSAEVYFQLAVERDASDPQARLNLGLALLQLGELEDAIENMKLAYSLSKNMLAFDLSVLKSIAAAEMRQKNYDEAIRSYGRVLEIDPDDGEAVYGLGLAYDQSNRFKEASYWYKKYVVMETGPEMNKSFKNYAKYRIKELAGKNR